MRIHALAMLLCVLAPVAAAADRKPALLDDLKARFDPSADKMKQTIGCKAEWKASAATTPSGQRYTLVVCAETNAQLMIQSDKVVAFGAEVVTRVDVRTADDAMKTAKTELTAAKCKTLRNQGQLAMYECPGGFALTLLHNWNSKSDTYTVSSLFGRADALLPMLGMPAAKK